MMLANETCRPVTSLAEGEEGIIHDIAGGHALISRLAGMGIVLNTRIRYLHASGGLVIVQVADTRVALGAGEAAKILVNCCLPREEKDPRTGTLLVALAGQPNAGKSTVFNILTGLSQHVGNWPGKTVEKKEGAHTADGVEMRIVDLPGTYSLTAFSEEEKVARDFIIHERPDVTVLLVNAAALERSLYLLAELLLLGAAVDRGREHAGCGGNTGDPDRRRRAGKIPRPSGRPDDRNQEPRPPGTGSADHLRLPPGRFSLCRNFLRSERITAGSFRN